MEDWNAQIARADAALDAGSAAEAASIAQSVLTAASQVRDVRAEAESLACLAKCDRVLSRFKRSAYASKRSAELFAGIGDIGGQSAALGTLAHAASVLGHDEVAVDAGLLSVHLAEAVGHQRSIAVAKIQLGVAYFFGGNYERAHFALDDAIHLSKVGVPSFSPFQARVTQGCAAMTRGLTERGLGQEPACESRYRQVLSAGEASLESGEANTIAAGVRVTAHALWFLVTSAWHIWSGDLEKADANMSLAADWVGRLGVLTSLDALTELMRAERACAVDDWEAATRHSRAAIELSIRTEHEQFARLGFMTAGRVLEAQGKHSDALRLTRDLAIRQHTLRAEGLEARSQVP